MNKLLEKFLRERRFQEALLTGQNLLNRNCCDTDSFDAYFGLLLQLAASHELNDAERYLMQASGALEFFSENIPLDEATVCYLLRKRQALADADAALAARKQKDTDRMIENAVSGNRDILSIISRLLTRAEETRDKELFEKTINQIGQCDQKIIKECLTEEDQQCYDTLTKRCSELMTEKLRQFERLKNVEYNLKAIEAYESVYRMFSGSLPEDHKAVIQRMFAFDQSKLFNPTLVYYNHVYNYVLGKLKDDEKFILTKYAIMSEQMR